MIYEEGENWKWWIYLDWTWRRKQKLSNMNGPFMDTRWTDHLWTLEGQAAQQMSQ